MSLGIRKSIKRFKGKNEFSNKEFLEFTRTIYKTCKSQNLISGNNIRINLSNIKDIDIVEKMDSCFIRFGVNRNKKFFIRSSNSGIVFYENYKNAFKNLPDFYQTFESLNENTQFQNSLSDLYDMFGPVCFEAELFPVLTHKTDLDDTIVFTATKYNKSKFGELGGFVLFCALEWDPAMQTWEKSASSFNICSKLKEISKPWQNDWKIFLNDVDSRLDGDVIFDISDVFSFINDENYDSSFQIVSCRKNTKEKLRILKNIKRTREKFQKSIDDFACKSKSFLGGKNSHVEGVIFRIKCDNEMLSVKGTSNIFDEQKRILWHDRMELSSLQKKFQVDILKNIFQVKIVTHASLNKKIKETILKFNSLFSINDEIKYLNAFYDFFILQINDSANYDVNVHLETKNILSDVLDRLNIIYDDFRFNKHKRKYDVNTVNKTETDFKRFKDDIYYIEKELNSKNININVFKRNLMKVLLGYKIRKNIKFEPGNGIPNDDRKKVIIWNGRAQPWHKGHHNMIMLGKEKLNELNADAILIMPVRGKETSKNVKKNPLVVEEQIKLINSLYSDDHEIIVHQSSLQSSFVNTIINEVHHLNYRIVGWLAGTDRIDSYRESLNKFSPSDFLLTHNFSPVCRNAYNKPLVTFIKTPRIIRATDVRNMVKDKEFKDWLNVIAPKCLNESSIIVYEKIYKSIKSAMAAPIKPTKANAGAFLNPIQVF